MRFTNIGDNVRLWVAGREEVECEQYQAREQIRANNLELTQASLYPGGRANEAGAPRRSPGTRRRQSLVSSRSEAASLRSTGRPSLTRHLRTFTQTRHLRTIQTDQGDSPRLATDPAICSKNMQQKYGRFTLFSGRLHIYDPICWR